MFEQNIGKEQQNHVAYFLNNDPNALRLKGLGETIAETNALLNSSKSQRVLAFRTQYLQQYSPRTIAAISKQLSE